MTSVSKALREAAETFRFYEASHREQAEGQTNSAARSAREGKAARNQRHAETCEAALSDYWWNLWTVVAVYLVLAGVTAWLFAGWLERRSLAECLDDQRPVCEVRGGTVTISYGAER